MKELKTKYPVEGRKAKTWAKQSIHGQWIPLMGAITKDDKVDQEGIRRGIRQAMLLDIGGLACSSLFEPWSSTHNERREQLEVFMDEVAGRLPVYATVTDHSLKETVQLAKHAFNHGAAIVTINCPYEHAKSDAQILAFFKYVCAELDGPVALYNTPHSGVILTPEIIDKLADIENVCAIKNAVGDYRHTAQLFKIVSDRIVISDPTERHYLKNIIEHGQQALFSTTASQLMQSPDWQPIEEYARAARSGDIERATMLYNEIEPLRKIWDDLYKVLWNTGKNPAEHPIAYTKCWQELMGMPAGPPRPPLLPITEAQRLAFVDKLTATGLMERFNIRSLNDHLHHDFIDDIKTSRAPIMSRTKVQMSKDGSELKHTSSVHTKIIEAECLPNQMTLKPQELAELSNHIEAHLPESYGPRLQHLGANLIPDADLFITSRSVNALNQPAEPNVVPHRHDVSQTYIFLSSDSSMEVEVEMNDQLLLVRAPATTFIPAGVTHALRILRGSGTVLSIVRSGNY